jgi:hypothetical protein
MGGRTQIRKSLHTSDLDKAKLLSLQMGQEVERELQALRKRQTALQTDPEAFTPAHQSSVLAQDAEVRARRDADDEELDVELDALSRLYAGDSPGIQSPGRRGRPVL